MPKISTEEVRINGDYYKLEINYSTQVGLFYAEVPRKFKSEFDLLDESTTNTLNARRDYKFRGDITKDIIVGTSEGEVKSNFTHCISMLSKMSTKKRDVIIVAFKDSFVFPSNEKKTFDDLTMTFGFTYAEELTIAENTPKYYQVRKYEAFGEEREDRREISHLRVKPCTIIDDTPENRQFLENLYSAFGNLISKMKDFMKDESSLLALISSQQKLLS